MTSKFWDADDVSLSDVSESIDSLDSKNLTKPEAKSHLNTNRWANLEDSSSDEEEKRVVRSAREKQWNQIKQTIKSMNNYRNIDDFSQLNTSLDFLMKSIRKFNLTEKEDCPKFLIHNLATFEDYMTEKNFNKEEIKKLSKTKSINFHTLKSKLRKYLESYRQLIDEYKTNPNSFDNNCVEMSDSSDSELPTEGSSQSAENNEENRSGYLSEVADSTSDENLRSSLYSESSDWSAESVIKKDIKISISSDPNLERGMKVWGKKPENKPVAKSIPKEKKKNTFKSRQKAQSTLETTIQQSKNKNFISVIQPDEKIDAKLISKKLRELNTMRKRKGFDYSDHIRYFQEITHAANSVSPQSYIESLNYLIGAYFDANPGLFASLNSQQWNQIYKSIDSAIDTLTNHEDTYFPLLTLEDDVTGPQTSDNDQNSNTIFFIASQKKNELKSNGKIQTNYQGSNTPENLQFNTALVLTTYIERLDNELYKALQLADLHSNEYKIRLNQIVDILVIMWKSYNYLSSLGQIDFSRITALRILHHMYYRNEEIGMSMWNLVKQKLTQSNMGILTKEGTTSKAIIQLLVRDIVIENNDFKSRILATLYYAYFLSLEGNYYQAKDLLQTANIHDFAMQCNISTQILYNRNLVQLGLAAFSLGLTYEAHLYLSEICNMGKYKELLAQGLSNPPKGLEKTTEQDRLEKQRLLPYHMHIASELVETVYNVCAMLIEIPYMVQNTMDNSRKPLTRNFRRQLELYDKQIFKGPPETSRETVYAAAKALQKGDWESCCELLYSLKIWTSFKNPEAVKQTISLKVQQEALRTYLFRYSLLYDAFDVDKLAVMFNLPLDITHSIVSKLLIQKKLDGSWDGAARCVLINRVERSNIQMFALHLTERITTSLEQNELLLAHKNSKFLLSQNFQREERLKKSDDKWADRKPLHNKGDWIDNRVRWDNTNPSEARRIKFTRFTVTTFEKNEQRRRKR